MGRKSRAVGRDGFAQFSTVAAGLPLLLHIFGLPSLKPVMRGKKRIKKKRGGTGGGSGGCVGGSTTTLTDLGSSFSGQLPCISNSFASMRCRHWESEPGL